MKIRNGFVSNSSSSSFIIDLTGTEKCPHCGREGLTAESIELLCAKDYDSDIRASGKAEVKEYIKEWWFNDGEIEKISKQIDTATYPILLNVDYNSEILKDMILSDKDIKIIYNEDA